MVMKRISRRRFLGGAAAATAASVLGPLVPLLPSHADDGYPLRFLVSFTRPGIAARDYSNGLWGPAGTESDFILRPRSILEPLADAGVKEDCVFLQGVDNLAYRKGPFVGGHPNGNGTALTGAPLQYGTLFSGGGPDTGGWPSGPSIDQHLASRLGDATRFRSLTLGVQVTTGSNLQGRVSYAGVNMPVTPDHDPASAFSRLFGASVAGGREEVDRLHADRRSVLDVVHQDLGRLERRLGAVDREKLQAHAAALREVEMRLAPVEPPGGAVCIAPGMAPRLDHLANANYPLVGDLMQDLMVQAFACDLTRFGLLQWSRGPGPLRYTWLGHSDNVHSMSHAPDSSPVQDSLTEISRWQAGKFARLLTALKAVPEGDGTLLDHTVVIWCTELSRANNHRWTNMPYVIGGGAAAGIAPNRFLTYEGATNNQLWVSMCHAFGLTDQTEFGDPELAQGPLPGLVAT